MEHDDAARLAKAAGVTRLLEEHPEAFRAALKSAAALVQRLPKDLDPAEECAHVLRLPVPLEDQR